MTNTISINHLHDETKAAEQLIRPFIYETPLEYSRYLSRLGNCRVYLKLENQQRTGSFKFRGAANFMLGLSKDELKRGIVTASTGNHATAVAEMLDALGETGTIYLPDNASAAKVETLKGYNLHLKTAAHDAEQTEAIARKDAETNGWIFVPPYNHPKIIAGQGTVALELERQIKRIDTLLAPVGGGGLMSGVSAYLKARDHKTRFIGCQPANSPVMAESVKAGHIVQIESKPTLADGSAGGIEPGSVTFDICKQTIDEFMFLSEKEISDALIAIMTHHQLMIEGAAALSVAAFLQNKDRFRDQTVVLILSGRKIAYHKLQAVVCGKNLR